MGLDTLEILLEIEERFDVSVLDHRASTILTVGELCDEVVTLLVQKGQPDTKALRDAVWSGIVQITVDQLGISPDSIRRDSKWVGDITKDG